LLSRVDRTTGEASNTSRPHPLASGRPTARVLAVAVILILFTRRIGDDGSTCWLGEPRGYWDAISAPTEEAAP
jgi:hypothetical protein